MLEAADHSYLEGRPGPHERVGAAAVGVLRPAGVRLLLVRVGGAHASCSATSRSTASSSRPTSRTPRACYGNVHEKIEASLAGATDEQRRRILWENAAELYRVDAPSQSTSVRDPTPPVASTRRGRPTSRPAPTTRAGPGPGAPPGPGSPGGAPAGRGRSGRSSAPAGRRPRVRRPAPGRRCRTSCDSCAPAVSRRMGRAPVVHRCASRR